ncbi:MAG: protein kinase [Thermoanaerobaculia bacterium]
MIGLTLSHFEVTAKLGEGGMGEVYRARDTVLGRDVALKVLAPEVASDPERLRRFEREARALATLDHPNIVTIHSVEEVDGVHFITMGLVDGKTLDRLISKGGVSLPKIFAIAIPAAGALAAAHERGVTHRDLKPTNVIVTDDGLVKILDFGLAKLRPEIAAGEATALVTETMTQAGRILGTVPYMSPEQVQGHPVDERSDIFSLGVMLYEMATGQRPFEGDTSAGLVSSILKDTPSRVDALRPELPHHLARIVGHCLEKDRESRYQSSKDVRNELQALAKELESEEILGTAIPARPAARSRNFRRRAAILAAAAAVTIIGLIVGPRVKGLRDLVAPTAGRPQIESLAVLPFDNLMKDPEQDYFVEGMHDALITGLSRIGALRLISRTSVMRYKGTHKTIPEIAAELDVDALIGGSVLRADGQVRITARLIAAATDEHLWAESYDRELENVLTLLSEVAQEIAGEIEVTLTPQEKERVAGVQQVDVAAQEAYFRGRFAFSQGSGAALRRSLELYERALQIQPDYALAQANVAAAQLLLGVFGHEPPGVTAPKARAAAKRALALDGNLDDAHNVLGWVQLYLDWDWEGAAQSFARALEINANHVYANHGYGDYLTVMGRPDAAVEFLKRGRSSDPLSPLANFPVAGHMVIARRFGEAVAESRRQLALGSEYSRVRSWLADALWHDGDREASLAEYRKLWAPDRPELIEALDRGYADAGPEGALREVARQRASGSNVESYDLLGTAGLLARVGDVDAAFELLERAYAGRMPLLFVMIRGPDYDSLRSDPRFDDLLQWAGLPRAKPRAL